MEAAGLCPGHADGTKDKTLDRAESRRRSGHGRLSPTHAVTSGRLLIYATDNHPHVTRSGLHRCLQRHGISRLPEGEGDKPAKKKFKPYPIGSFPVDIAEVSTEEGKLYWLVAIDRTSQFAYAELHEQAHQMIAAEFLRNLITQVPYQLHTVLTDHGIQLTNRKTDHSAFPPIFGRGCQAHGIEPRLTPINHPWTNGQVERMNRTLKDATVKRYHSTSHEQLKTHLDDFLNAYNFAQRLKSLRGFSPYQFIIQVWQQDPDRFRLNPALHTRGLNS